MQLFGLRNARPEDLEPLLLVLEIVLRIVERLHRHEAMFRQRLLQLILPARLRKVRFGLIEVAQVGIASLRQRKFLAAHVVQLLLDLGLFLECRQLKFGVRKHGEELALRHMRAVFDKFLIDASTFNSIKIDGDQRRDAGT